MLTLDKVYHAAYILKEVARRTDLIYAPELSHDTQLYLKTENLQVTGSFKVRGAYYKISQLNEEQKKAGIIACSAGNHAQGVALAATKMGIRSTVCMPDGAPLSKVEATRRLGAEICLVKGAYDDAYAKALEIQQETGATLIHPFDDEQVVAGQGTIGLEVLEQLPDAEAVIVPIGGGGLISGVPFADGIAVKHPGDLTFALTQRYVDDVVTVSEDEIAAAILTLMEKQKLVAEGAGAVSVAAALFHKVPIQGKKTVCILSGGNIDVNILSRVITRGLVTSGRMAALQIALEDKPGQLVGVSEIISRCGGNVISVHHERSDANMPISSCYLKVGMETRSFEQIQEIENTLRQAGFQIISERL